MHLRILVLAAASLGLAGVAQANCDALVKKASTVSADQIGPTFAELATCDAALAKQHFDDFLRASKDVETLTALTYAAIDNKVHEPVHTMLEKVTDMSMRDQVAKAIGEQCGDHSEFVPFLQGAHSSLGDRQFGMWREAFKSCTSDDLAKWLGEVTANPPGVAYDEKYNVISEAYVKSKKADALPTLQKAAVAASSNGGPFSTVLDRMNDAVRPDTFGADIPEEDRKKLEAALVDVAKKVSPEMAAQVADRLYQAGAEDAAASLLPTIYADRVQKGKLVYGVASVETCDDLAVIHYAEVTEPAKRWSIGDDVQGPAREFKPRLKCTPEGEWPVMTTPEPLVKGGLDAWIAEIEGEWAAKGVSVKLREEKGFSLE